MTKLSGAHPTLNAIWTCVWREREAESECSSFVDGALVGIAITFPELSCVVIM